MSTEDTLEQIKNNLTMAAAGHRHDQRGYFSLAELPQRKPVGDSAISPGWDVLAEIWKLYPGQFTAVTGTPGHGKSTLMLNVVCNIAKTHDWHTFLYVPENEAYLQWKLRRIYGSRGFDHFAKNQCFVQSAEVQSYNQAPKSIDWVLERAVVGIKRDGVNLLMIDPWNELEHAKPRDWTMTEYITHCLMYLKQFSRAYGVAVIVVAHPTKSHATDGRQPTLYDIESSAAWFNKCDNGLIVARDSETDHMTVTSAKVRERGAGKRGKCLLLVNEHEQVTDLSGVVL
jgi:twinkle protein